MWYDYTTYTRSIGSKYPILKLYTSELACFNVVVQTELFTGYMEIALSTSKVQQINNLTGFEPRVTSIRSFLVSWCSFSIIGSSFSWVKKGQV